MPINLVIDQNVLRKDVPLRAAIADVKGRGEKLVLPDMALAQMMKADQWETTTRASLRILAETPDVVVVSHALGPLMKVECDTGEPTKDIVDVDVTPRFQELLSELHRGDGPAVARIKTTIDEARALAAGQHFAHARNKENVKKIVEACKHDLTKDELTLARREDEGFLRQLLASVSMMRTCRDALVGAGYDEKRVNGLAIERSISSHEFLTFVSIALRWLKSVGVSSPLFPAAPLRVDRPADPPTPPRGGEPTLEPDSHEVARPWAHTPP